MNFCHKSLFSCSFCLVIDNSSYSSVHSQLLTPITAPGFWPPFPSCRLRVSFHSQPLISLHFNKPVWLFPAVDLIIPPVFPDHQPPLTWFIPNCSWPLSSPFSTAADLHPRSIYDSFINNSFSISAYWPLPLPCKIPANDFDPSLMTALLPFIHPFWSNNFHPFLTTASAIPLSISRHSADS